MAIDYQSLTPQERLNRIAQIINRGVYLYHQKADSKIEGQLQEQKKDEVSVVRIKCKENEKNKCNKCINDRILTTKEAMEFLKVSRTTLWRIRKQKEINFYLIGKTAIRYALSNIMEYLESSKYYK